MYTLTLCLKLKPNDALTLNAVNIDVCPVLTSLMYTDRLYVRQQVETLEALTGYESTNKYAVLASLYNGGGRCSGKGGQPILYLAEEPSGWWNLHCGGPGRPFRMSVRDPAGRELFHFFRRGRHTTVPYTNNIDTDQQNTLFLLLS